MHSPAPSEYTALHPDVSRGLHARLPSPYRDESARVKACLQQLDGALNWAATTAMARPWVSGVRDHPPPFWAMESLLREYPISSHEGLALMRLAEALLRVPDTETAIALTSDQLGSADFSQAGDRTLARLSGFALHFSKRMLPDDANASTQGLLARLGANTVVAATVRAVQLLGKQFVLGQDIEDALNTAERSRRKQAQLSYSYDMLGEGARTEADAQRYLASYQHAIQQLTQHSNPDTPPEHKDGISIKLSALHPRYEALQSERVTHELVPRVWMLCKAAAQANLNLTIDAEEVDRLELSLDVFEALAQRVSQHYPQWQGFGLAMQAYQTRALELVQVVIAIARKYGLRLMCRLVKGAYWDSEVKRAQELGLPHFPVFTHKHHTDISYLACAHALLQAPDAIYPQFAGHNAGTIAAVLQMAHAARAPFELQRLHGMGEGVFRELLAQQPTLRCRVYAPVGQHRDLLAYLVRRLLENGANSSFVHQLADTTVDADALLASPLYLGAYSDDMDLRSPPDLYGPERRNSEGRDLAEADTRAELNAALVNLSVSNVTTASLDACNTAAQQAKTHQPAWAARSVNERTAILHAAADQLERELATYCALIVQEAHKTWGDAISEVREAVDFLRYYALQAERLMAPQVLPGVTGEQNTLRLGARGTWVAISPWNFPLAIFVGQVAAALVTGNAVLAKPAEQTPRIAQAAITLLHRAGVPSEVLHLLNGPGETIGAALVAHSEISGVVFTGSTAVARHINRALAAKDGPIVPFIAETGGINAMLVDSTALPEQVTDAVVQSAFRSAGQRCSALRLLCLHEAVADAVLTMMTGAAAELRLGPGHHYHTDVGPVIDAEAYANIQRQLSTLPVAHSIAGQDDPEQQLIAPRIVLRERISDVSEEIFGPVLQVVRWQGDPRAVIADINALGYGLTLGLQTRIDSRAETLAHTAKVGNIYVNRNMIGAVVGSQPFGGEGLSGTGPKAGGPHYLLRFCTEQTVTINTAAAGGNAELLAAMR